MQGVEVFFPARDFANTVSLLDRTPLPPLRCTVRGCARPLSRRERSLACDAGHAFDLARSGYANLLQPQDRRSLDAGDTKEQVEARRRLLECGVGRALINEVAGFVPKAHGWVLEVGCGPGLALARIVATDDAQAIGLDLSMVAIERASRSFPGLDWVVANADRSLPFEDASLDCVVSIASPKNPGEFRRVLRAGARAIVAVPAEDDLIELREAVLGEGRVIERAEKAIERFSDGFRLGERAVVRERFVLDRAGLRDLLDASYRGARIAEANRAQAIEQLEVTTSTEILVFVAVGPESRPRFDRAQRR